MNFSVCPRVKSAKSADGTFRFTALRVFTVGGGDRFVRALRAFLPTLPVETVSRDDANVILSVASVFSSQNEYCAIRIRENRMEIRCRDNDGARNAAAILAQLLHSDAAEWSLPCGDVEDWPDASYRAMMLESSGRSWISLDRLYLYLREMALARMNVLQFHFMENPGCTIALDCYPEMHGYGEDNLKYTKDEIRAFIAKADEYGISVTPFVEVVSHSVAFNKVADIACPGDTDENMFAVCVGQEKTFDAIERVLREVAELFPDPVIHIGADEYDMSAVTPRTVHWDLCPHCRALAERMGYTTLRELFLYAIERVNGIVNKLGKVAMMWNADLEPGKIPDSLERNVIVHFYRCDNPLGREKIYELSPGGYAEDGFAVLNSYFPETYMDVEHYMNTERLNSWSFLSQPRVSEKHRASVIGGACCAWDDFRHFERTIPPAILLFADRLWNALGDPVPYDDAYGRLMTRILFEGMLPDDLNVFTAVGGVLPPLSDKKLFHKRIVMEDCGTLTRIRDALKALTESDCDASIRSLAVAYLEIAEAAIAYHAENAAYTGPRKTTVAFDG